MNRNIFDVKIFMITYECVSIVCFDCVFRRGELAVLCLRTSTHLIFVLGLRIGYEFGSFFALSF